MKLQNRSSASPRSNHHPSNTKAGWLAAVFLAYTIGVYHGSQEGGSYASSSGSLPILLTEPSQANNNSAGWGSVDVFYGRHDLYEKEVADSSNLTSNWFGQARQDEIVAKLFRHKKSGYFVDLAANDAMLLSNTYALEKQLGWRGLCIEPNPIYWKNLSLLRDCQIVAAVVGQTRLEAVHFRFEAGDHGGIAGDNFDNGPRWKSRSEQRYTVPLIDILERYHAPKNIDYLSLDVEGAESFIMLDFPWNRYRIKVLTAERLRGPIRQVLKDHGYQHIQKLTRWGETLWIHESMLPSLDVGIIAEFRFPVDN